MNQPHHLMALLNRANSFTMDNGGNDSPQLVLCDAVTEIAKLKAECNVLKMQKNELSARLKRIEDVIWNVK